MSKAHLVPAIKHGEKIYKGEAGYDHSEALPRHLRDKMDDEQKGYEDYKMKTGFVNHKGHFLNERQAMDYAKEHGLVNHKFHKSPVLTSDMLPHDDDGFAFRSKHD